jgi:hypothetical protein
MCCLGGRKGLRWASTWISWGEWELTRRGTKVHEGKPQGLKPAFWELYAALKGRSFTVLSAFVRF